MLEVANLAGSLAAGDSRGSACVGADPHLGQTSQLMSRRRRNSSLSSDVFQHLALLIAFIGDSPEHTFESKYSN